MQSKKRRAFSMSETLMTMGIIGLLAVTMLSMNNFTDNKQQIAQTKFPLCGIGRLSLHQPLQRRGSTSLPQHVGPLQQPDPRISPPYCHGGPSLERDLPGRLRIQKSRCHCHQTDGCTRSTALPL